MAPLSADPSGLAAPLKLSLTRSAGGRCQLYSPTKERFSANLALRAAA